MRTYLGSGSRSRGTLSGTSSAPIISHRYLTSLARRLFVEINDVFDRVMALPEVAPLIEEVRKSGRKKDAEAIKRSVCNRVWVDIENDILMACLDYCRSVNLNLDNVVLMFDGFMLPGDQLMPPNWTDAMAEMVREITGYKMGFVEKPMTEGRDIADLPLEDGEVYQELDGCYDDLVREICDLKADADMAELCVRTFGHSYAYDGDKLWVFRGHRWVDYGAIEFPREFAALTLGFHKVEDIPTKELKKTVASIRMNKRANAVMDLFQKSLMDPGFRDRLDAKRHLVGFNNGVLDLDAKAFRPGQPEDYITLSTGYDYHEVADTSDVEPPPLSVLTASYRTGVSTVAVQMWQMKGGLRRTGLLSSSVGSSTETGPCRPRPWVSFQVVESVEFNPRQMSEN